MPDSKETKFRHLLLINEMDPIIHKNYISVIYTKKHNHLQE